MIEIKRYTSCEFCHCGYTRNNPIARSERLNKDICANCTVGIILELQGKLEPRFTEHAFTGK